MELLINDYGHDEIIDQIPEKIVERTERMIEFPVFQYSFFLSFFFLVFVSPVCSSCIFLSDANNHPGVRAFVCSWQLCCNMPRQNMWA